MSNPRNRNPRLVGSVALLVLLSGSLAYGQSTTWARLVGTVTDQSGALVPGVDVTAVNKETNVTHKTLTNERGDYLIDKLRPGLYDVSAEMSGFRKQLFPAVRLETGQVRPGRFRAHDRARLPKQSDGDGVSPIINTEKAEIGSVVEEKKIRELPLRGRDITKLAFLTTGGTQEAQDVGLITQVVGYGGGTPAFNGMYSHSNSVQLDGSNNTRYSDSRMAVTPTPETVQEFKLITNNYSAEYGKIGGAVISMSSKSGSNEFHGDAWYYFRNERLTPVVSSTTASAGASCRSTTGSWAAPSAGRSSRTRRSSTGTTSTSSTTLRSPASRRFRRCGGGPAISAWRTARSPRRSSTILTTWSTGSGSRFPGTSSRRAASNPISANLMQLLPIPEPNVAGANANNFSYGQTVTSSRINKWSTRVDHHFSERIDALRTHQLAGDPVRSSHTGVIGAPGMLAGVYQQFVEPAGGYNMAGGWVKPFGANVVSELNVVGWKSRRIISRSIDQENWEEKLGFDTASALPDHRIPTAAADPAGMPRVSPAGYMAWGPGAVESPLGDWGVEAKYSIAWKKGDHYFKFGFGHIQNRGVGYLYVPQGVGPSRFDGYATGQVIRERSRRDHGRHAGRPVRGLPARRAVELRRQSSRAASATAIPVARGASINPTTPPSSRTSGRCRATSA